MEMYYLRLLFQILLHMILHCLHITKTEGKFRTLVHLKLTLQMYIKYFNLFSRKRSELLPSIEGFYFDNSLTWYKICFI